MQNYCLLQYGDIIEYGDLSQRYGCGDVWFNVESTDVGLTYTAEEYMPMKRLLVDSYLKKNMQLEDN